MDIILDMGNVLLEWNKDKILQGVRFGYEGRIFGFR